MPPRFLAAPSSADHGSHGPQPQLDVPTLSLPSDLSPFPSCYICCTQLFAPFSPGFFLLGTLCTVLSLPSLRSGVSPGALHPRPSHLLQHPLPDSAASPADMLSPELQWPPWPPTELSLEPLPTPPLLHRTPKAQSVLPASRTLPPA